MSEFDQDQERLPEFIKDPVGVLQRRWRSLVVAIGLGLFTTIVAVVLHVPLFLAESTVLVAEQQISTDFVPTTVQQNPIDRVNTLLGEVFTPTNLLALIEEHGLYPVLRKRGDSDELVSTMRTRIAVESADGFQTTRRNQAAVILAVRFEAEDAQTSADVANDLAALFTDADLAVHSRQARLTTEFLRRELVKAERDLQENATALAMFRQEHRGELPSDLGNNQARYERLQERRAALVTQLSDSERRLSTLAAGGFPTDDSPGAQMQRLRTALSQELAVHTEQHPNVVMLRESIAILEKDAEDGGGNAGESLHSLSLRDARAQAAQIRTGIATIDASLEELDARIERTHQWSDKLAAMEQKTAIYGESYDELLRKVEGAERAEDLYRAQQGAKVKVLDPARAPLEAESRRGQIAVAGIVGSILLGLFTAFLFEWRDPVVSTIEGLELAAGVPVFGTIPRIS